MNPQIVRLVASLGIASGVSISVAAQMLGPQTSASTAVSVSAPGASPASIPGAVGPHLTPEQLDQLLGPIALYPDALVALIFPAATESSDIVLAARYLAGGGDPAHLDDQPWDDSVKALAHYPELVKWMDENLAWTKQVGETFLDQPDEMMKAVQHLRTEAKAAGTLVDTPQQQVVAEGEVISIVPTQPDVIYVPYYDPSVVYVRRGDYYPGSYFSFSVGYPVGFWLGYNVDWGHRRILVVDRSQRERYWHQQHDWRRPVFSGGVAWTQDPVRRPWNSHSVHPQPVRPVHYNRPAEIVRPSPIALQTQRPPAISRGSTAGRVEHAPGNREAPRAVPTARGTAAPLTEGFQPSATPPASAQPSASATAPAAAPAISRGNRGPQSASQPQSQSTGPRESRGRSGPARGQGEAPATGRSVAPPAPATAPAPSTPSNGENPQPVSRASHANHAAWVASAPQPQAAAPAQSGSPAPSDSGRHRYRSQSERRD